jgi:hypothetical protein
VCGKTARDIRGLRAHERSHQTVTCPDCGATVGALGIGSHRHHVHGVVGARTTARRRAAVAEAEARRASALTRTLTALIPGAAPHLVDRLARFVAKYRPEPDIWAVATLDDGPWLCHRVQVGTVANGRPIVAVPTALIYQHLQEAAA